MAQFQTIYLFIGWSNSMFSKGRRKMRLHIRARNIELTETLKHYIERRLQFALGRFGRTIRQVTIRLSDVNGPRGGRDKSCHVEVRLIPDDRIIVGDTQSDLYAAINGAIERAVRAVSRQLARERELGTSRSVQRALSMLGEVVNLADPSKSNEN